MRTLHTTDFVTHLYTAGYRPTSVSATLEPSLSLSLVLVPEPLDMGIETCSDEKAALLPLLPRDLQTALVGGR